MEYLLNNNQMTNSLIYKYMDFSYRNIKMLYNRKIYAPSLDKFNDPFEMGIINVINPDHLTIGNTQFELNYLKMLKSRKNDFQKLNQSGVFCTSKTNDNHLMWGHYANGSRGFCVGYDKDVLIKSTNPRSHFKINYPHSSDFTPNIYDCYSDEVALGTKVPDWSYEKEYRLVFNKDGEFTYDDDCVKEIIFGSKSNSDDVFFLKNILDGRNILFIEQYISSSVLIS